jgi:hypothetical protein
MNTNILLEHKIDILNNIDNYHIENYNSIDIHKLENIKVIKNDNDEDTSDSEEESDEETSDSDEDCSESDTETETNTIQEKYNILYPRPYNKINNEFRRLLNIQQKNAMKHFLQKNKLR